MLLFMLKNPEPKKAGRYITDFLCSAFGLIVMNAVLSLVIQPYLGNTLGAANQGRILYYTTLAVLMGSTFGSGANYARMKIRSSEGETKNGDYNFYLLIAFGILVLVTVGALLLKGGDQAEASIPGLMLLVIVTTVRHYADVDFRLSKNYKRFSIYYCIIGAGYLVGLVLYLLLHSWVLIFLTGELGGLLYVGFAGTIFKKPVFQVSERFPAHLKLIFGVVVSFILSDFVGSSDRLLLPVLLENGNEAAALFYYASLIGKLMSLVSTPLNGVLAGHLFGKEQGITKKRFLTLTLILLGVFAAFTGLTVLGSMLFIYLFYRPYYEAVKPLFWLANAGQVLFFICNTMMVIVLRYTDEKIQLLTSGLYVVLFLAITIPLILAFGIWGMAWGFFIANAVKFVLYVVLGASRIGRQQEAISP